MRIFMLDGPSSTQILNSDEARKAEMKTDFIIFKSEFLTRWWEREFAIRSDGGLKYFWKRWNVFKKMFWGIKYFLQNFKRESINFILFYKIWKFS